MDPLLLKTQVRYTIIKTAAKLNQSNVELIEMNVGRFVAQDLKGSNL